MGVDARLVVYAPNKPAAEDACAAAYERIAQLDSIMSDYQINSELNRLCRKAGQGPVHVSPDLFNVLQEAITIARRSDGMKDPTVGPIVRLWRKARKTQIIPSPHQIRAARKLVGWRKVKLDAKSQTVSLAVPGMQLDLGGIGKGYADDAAQGVLKHHGISQALVEMGGDIVVSNPPPGEKGWTIQVPNATDKHGAPILRFANCAISSSG
ncbi:MAG TPA: FAD:protein FMN transferase, partial [Fimbriimonas sp.]|nr:FAD:protein FMN transferase [Fimbriimonas sp.]